MSKFYEEPTPVKSTENLFGPSSESDNSSTFLDKDFFKLEKRDSMVKMIANVNMMNFELLLA